MQGAPGVDIAQETDDLLAMVFSGVPARVFLAETQLQRVVTFRFHPRVPAAEVAAADAMFRELPSKVSCRSRAALAGVREPGRASWGAGAGPGANIAAPPHTASLADPRCQNSVVRLSSFTRSGSYLRG